MIKIYEVGGCVRDELLGLPSKDIDFVVVAESFSAMKEHLLQAGFKVYMEEPRFVTLRCNIPENHPLRQRTRDADFVLARKDAPTGDGRRPDYVEAGTLLDDLSRRDFTINALAKDPETGLIIDHFGGQGDLTQRILRFVGDPYQRIAEDGLRVLRAFRFKITKGLTLCPRSEAALSSGLAAEMLTKVSLDRIREELNKMLAYDTLSSLNLLGKLPTRLQNNIFRQPLHLSATLKKI